MKKIIALLIVAVWQFSVGFQAAQSQTADPLDPTLNFDPFEIESQSENQLTGIKESDISGKTNEQVLLDAEILMARGQPLDARSLLLKLLARDPHEQRAHAMLASYYLTEVAHYRLSLKYSKRALELFYEKKGKPPYFSALDQNEHARLLYLLSQSRLNLDDYQGALDVLDELASYGYFTSWYASSRAWVLMKLGRIKEAVKVAKLSALSDSEMGRSLNMLGILLSMDQQKSESIGVFKEAIRYEFSLGPLGQPATPLNNVGEVYKELFEDELAESTWRRAISLPDSCEHVLPYLNLALLLIDQLRLDSAENVVDKFKECVAQYPLRNAEEHRALTDLARGRIAMHRGQIQEAIVFFENSLSHRQWFGKIGTNTEDLEVAATISLGQAYAALKNILKATPSKNFWESLAYPFKLSKLAIFERWYHRRARGVLINKLKNIEDFYIRNTDSLIEYPTFGDTLAGLSTAVLRRRVQLELQKDARPKALAYYNMYEAQNIINNSWRQSSRQKALELTNQSLANFKAREDKLAIAQALWLKIKILSANKNNRSQLTEEIFKLYSISPTELLMRAVPLPVRFNEDMPSDLRKILNSSNFELNNKIDSPLTITGRLAENKEIMLGLESKIDSLKNFTLRGKKAFETSAKFRDILFKIR
ncbi:MAG TPA: hypothetical protein PKD37_03450 [Oligoflexia bacterium]|nr:hypothetical protein [Oligoflexia bacterium]HMP27025.1 hypothetical protein [Oligoflexia bacterium]